MTIPDGTLHLKDGRRLGYAEYGDPAGRPLFHFHGIPGSRLFVMPGWDGATGGVRLVCADRPGIGLSDFKPARRLLDWPDDVRELADHLGFDRFHVSGVSGGGPHALACAYRLPDRVIACGTIAGAGPFDDPAAVEGMHKGNRTVFALASKAPFLLRALMEINAFVMRRWPERSLRATLSQLPPPDREILEDPEMMKIAMRAGAEAYRQGARGVAHEARMYLEPWGFRPQDVEVPVLLWQGEKDRNVPPAMGRALAAAIPNCTATFYPDDGHLLAFRHWPEIVSALMSAG